ncbi:hypothetical protein EJ05DRAFT_501010 [Pseudovirgaria hyperparasitica]|uniref:Uncharacterized protein n=1 Tax=Pseudovirgaria hyperparasitica TaxID=470096 RepID=A0A6A6W4J3_9PEZI|nr:uncharacterized protein EJ05DRAFT_501010 [Pseudovirgaria hyperparasitica]KAF2757475.1 hypothetical protein EJ05DRAFT_501010 [Pseudovirgaria hyperparasitica]
MHTLHPITLLTTLLLLASIPTTKARHIGPITTPNLAWHPSTNTTAKRTTPPTYCSSLPEPVRSECIISYTWYTHRLRTIYTIWFDAQPDYEVDDLARPAAAEETRAWYALGGRKEEREGYEKPEEWVVYEAWMAATGGYGFLSGERAAERQVRWEERERGKAEGRFLDELWMLRRWGRRGTIIA